MKEDPEFDEQETYRGGTPERLLDLILEKSDLKFNNVSEKFQEAWEIWGKKQWVG